MPKKEPKELKDVMSHFRVYGDYVKSDPLGNGHINFESEKNEFWRVFFCIESAVSYDIMKDEEAAYKTAKAFGEFQKSLSGIYSKSLHETIPGFHNTPKRFDAFVTAIKNDTAGRVGSVKKEIDFIMERKEKCKTLFKMHEEGIIQERTVHNDTKLNNIMFDIQTDEPICVLDLDLVMPGFSAYDFGDMVRTITTPAAEDEIDLSKVEMQFNIYKALFSGFLDSTKGFLSKSEIKSLPYGGYVITFEQAIRFLTDYLNGDIYYKIHRPDHNLDMSRTQIKLIQSIEQQWDNIIKFTNIF